MSQDETKRRHLGRGLSSLLGEDIAAPSEDPDRTPRTVPASSLRPTALQPRRQFADAELETLAESIRAKGILQPILVRPAPGGDYEIIAGERRWRAAQRAGLHDLPVVVRDMSDREVLEVALVENIQRSDLTAIEEASGYARLIEEFGHSHEGLATALGKSRSHIANTMRLLSLPKAVQDMLEGRQMTPGQARPLIGLENAEALARAIVTKGLSAREAERLAQKAKNPAPTGSRARARPEPDTDSLALQHGLSASLGLKVELKPQGAAGSLTIHYKSLEQLDDLVQRLSVRRPSARS